MNNITWLDSFPFTVYYSADIFVVFTKTETFYIWTYYKLVQSHVLDCLSDGVVNSAAAESGSSRSYIWLKF